VLFACKGAGVLSLSLPLSLSLSPSLHTLFTSQRERERERERERRETERERKRCRICPEFLFLFLKGMTGALAPLSYLVKDNNLYLGLVTPSVGDGALFNLSTIFSPQEQWPVL
jgi:hypothetical protein